MSHRATIGVSPAQPTASTPSTCSVPFSCLPSKTFQHETTHRQTRKHRPRTKDLLTGGGQVMWPRRPSLPSRLLRLQRLLPAAGPLHITPSRNREAIYPRLTGKKLVFIDRLLTAELAISISVFVSLTVCLCTSACRRPRGPTWDEQGRRVTTYVMRSHAIPSC